MRQNDLNTSLSPAVSLQRKKQVTTLEQKRIRRKLLQGFDQGVSEKVSNKVYNVAEVPGTV